MNTCVRCGDDFIGRYPKSKICKSCSKRGMPRGKGHWNFKDGSFTYETFRQELKEQIRYCQHCSVDLSEATHYMWVIHHKDHNHYNNELDNLELLCKRYHQIEHECWLAFESVTTIPKGSSSKQSEAPNTRKGDDIVYSSWRQLAAKAIAE